MRWTLRKAYLYLVSLVTFIMSLIGFWNLANNAVDLIWPAPSYYVCAPAEGKDADVDLQQCAEQQRQEEERQRIYRLQGLAKSAIFLVIVVPAYLYHWKEANRSEDANA